MLCSSHHIKTQFNRSHHFLLNITRFSFMMVPPLVFFSRLPGSFSLFSVVSPSSTRLLNVGVLLDIPELRLSLLTLRFLPKESHPFIRLFIQCLLNTFYVPDTILGPWNDRESCREAVDIMQAGDDSGLGQAGSHGDGR